MSNKTFNGSMVVTKDFEAKQLEKKNGGAQLSATPSEICEAVKSAFLKYGAKFMSASSTTCSGMVLGELESTQNGKCA